LAAVLLAGAVLLAVLRMLAGESSRAMVASARVSCLIFEMAAVRNLKFFKFLNFQYFGHLSGRNVHRHTNFIKINQIIAYRI